MMTTRFTLRDLNRRPAQVLQACDRFGAVQIRTREGKNYVLQLQPRETPMGPLPDFKSRRAKLRELGMKSLSKREQRRFDRWLAGEE